MPSKDMIREQAPRMHASLTHPILYKHPVLISLSTPSLWQAQSHGSIREALCKRTNPLAVKPQHGIQAVAHLHMSVFQGGVTLAYTSNAMEKQRSKFGISEAEWKKDLIRSWGYFCHKGVRA